jgi:hypothetical protein
MTRLWQGRRWAVTACRSVCVARGVYLKRECDGRGSVQKREKLPLLFRNVFGQSAAQGLRVVEALHHAAHNLQGGKGKGKRDGVQGQWPVHSMGMSS